MDEKNEEIDVDFIKLIQDGADFIETTPAGVSIEATMAGDVEQELHFPSDMPSGVIAASTFATFDLKLEPEEKQEFINSLDIVKTYVSEIELGLSMKGFNFKIKREPKKIIRSYKVL